MEPAPPPIESSHAPSPEPEKVRPSARSPLGYLGDLLIVGVIAAIVLGLLHLTGKQVDLFDW